MALFLTENDVKQLLTVTMALEGVESAHRDLSLGHGQDTPRARTRLPQTVLHILQGALPAQGVIGYKAYTTNRSGNRFLVHLFDAASGRLQAIIEADYMGMIRTGAASGLAARLLAPPGARVAGVFGAGWQAEGHIRAICAALPLEKVKVFSRNTEKLHAFCRRLSEMTGVAVVPAASPEEAVRGSALLGTVTTADAAAVRCRMAGAGHAHQRRRLQCADPPGIVGSDAPALCAGRRRCGADGAGRGRGSVAAARKRPAPCPAIG